MTNTKNNLLITSILSLLLIGSSVIPMQTYADQHKKIIESKSAIKAGSEVEEKSASQHSDHDNFALRSDGTSQANEGQQETGNGNDASGFNNQSANLQEPTQSPLAKESKKETGKTTPSALTVSKHVECNLSIDNVECPPANAFKITATTSNGSSISFNGSESGTILKINPPLPVTYGIEETAAPKGFVVDTIPVEGGDPLNIAFDPNNGLLYVTNDVSNTVSAINPSTNTVVATIPVVRFPIEILFNPNNGLLYVTHPSQDIISVINPSTNTVVATLPMSGGPIGIDFNPNNGLLYFTNENINTVSVLNPSTNTVVGTIPVGEHPTGITFNPNNGLLYVVNDFSNTVSVLNPSTNTVVGTIPVGFEPANIAFNPNNGLLYVTNLEGHSVSVLNPSTNTVVATIPAGEFPTGVAFNPNNGYMYVSNNAENTVLEINPSTNTVVGTIPVGIGPQGIAFDPNNGLLYVANQGSGNISVIATPAVTYSSGCNGTIDNAGQTAECTVTNAYGRPA